ncbi:MAG TPA: hypothetical protein VD907_06785 [Verrucomicrobiae bacterium]|nr:hypothetical protein [Verrucomicrobiae bacterium]
MTFDEMTEAVREAKETTRRADSMVGDMLEIIYNRIRLAPDNYWNNKRLAYLKKSLQDFDAKQLKWKD